jgi:hypothetical protein
VSRTCGGFSYLLLNELEEELKNLLILIIHIKKNTFLKRENPR